ncbi:hypothetical protein BGX23_009839 [Mortierella sp. AD031]|nr:hypothetical protein BGX23_009839 [Mortierella sp. AD031]
MITILALVMYFRNRTRLRLNVVLFSILGLSASVAGFLWSAKLKVWSTEDGTNIDKLSTDLFWIWSFAAEGVGTVVLASTVVMVGTVFYSRTGRKNIFLVLSIVMIVMYATVAAANVIVYIKQVNGVALKNTLAGGYEECIQWMEGCIRERRYPDDRFITATGFDWRRKKIEVWKEYKLNPSPEVYVPNKVLTAVVFLWVSMYLFVPLLRNRNHRPVIGSDMTAVGIWYLSCLSILVTDADDAYSPWVQALDVSLRGTIGIVFSLPAPKFIIQFARRYYGHQRSKEGDFNNRTHRDIGPRHRGMFSSSTNYSQDCGGSSSITRSPEPAFATTAKAGVPVEDPLTFIEDHSSRSNNINFGSIKLFPTRNRGESMESSKMFNQDFEPEDLQDGHLTADEGHHRDSFHQYYSKMEISATPSSLSRNSNHLTLHEDLQEKSKSISLSEAMVEELQRPAPAFTVVKVTERQAVLPRSFDSPVKSSLEDNVLSKDPSVSPNHNKDSVGEPQPTPKEVGPLSTSTQQETSADSTGVTGSTGWEVGGWGHPRETSSNSLAHPLEQPPKPQKQPDLVYNVETGIVSVMPELTGLQAQLAQYQSSLLPSAIAIQHYDPADNCPPALRAQMEAAFASYLDSLPPDVDIDGRIKRPGQELDLITADDEPKMTRYLNERFRVYQQNQNQYAYDRAYWIKYSSKHPKPSAAESRREEFMDDVILDLPRSNAGKMVEIVRRQPPPPNFAPPQPPPTATAGLKKKWLPGRKSYDVDRQPFQGPALKANEADRAPSGGERRGSLTNSAIEGAQSPKLNKPKEGRLGVFSKVLSSSAHKGADKGRTSQDILDQEREREKVELTAKFESKSTGPLQISAPAPATVEALAKSSSLGQLKEEVEDKGLQFYYPDPYFSLTETRKPQSVSTSSSTKERGIPSSSSSSPPQRHPLSPTFPKDRDPRTDSTYSTKPATGIAGPLASSKSQMGPFDYCLQSPILDMSKSDTATISSSKSGKTSLSSRKSSRPDMSIPQGATSIVGTAPNTPLPQPTGLGSLLSRSSSNSKKIGAKFKVRDGRSKSDVAPGRTSADLIQSSVAALPITTTRKPSIPSIPVSAQPSSLSPPPRQSWSRSKSYQDSSAAPPTAQSTRIDGEAAMKIDVQLANELLGAENSAVPSSGGTRSSISSSLGSPTTDSPTLTPISEVRGKPAKKETLSSPASSPSTTPVSSFSRFGGISPRTSQEHRNNSLDRESEFGFSAAKSRSGLSTAAMDLRRATNRPQRSVDNLASAYFYRRAAEYSNGSTDVNLRGEKSFAVASSSSAASSPTGIPPPSSPQLVSSGFSYYGVGSNGGGDSGRNSPHHRDSFLGQKNHHKSQSSLDFGHHLPVLDIGSVAATVGGDSGRTNSVTSSLHLMADDQWTQAMVARAQSSNPSASTPSGGSAATTPTGAGARLNHQQHSHSFSQTTIQYPASPARSPSPGLFAPSSFSSRPIIARTGSE